VKEIYVHADFTRVGHCRAILEEAGIPCFIRNESAQNLLSGLPDSACHPALCVTNDADAGKAVEVLRDFLAGEEKVVQDDDSGEWKCPQCGETVPGNFGSCWKCETQRPAVGAAN
jgi:hypothetical protein